MAQEILINYTPQEVRVALLEKSVLQEVHIERRGEQGLLGNIYKGRIKQLLPGIQSAFVDIGLKRPAFLHVSDLANYEPGVGPVDIRELLRVGQDLLVQVYKEPLGTKGARLTTQLTIPSRYLVLTPGVFTISVSQRILDENDRQRLMNLISPGQFGGYIFRTVAENISEEDCKKDQAFLDLVWAEINMRLTSAKIGDLVYEEIPMILRVVRDLASRKVTKILIDDSEAAEKMRNFSALYAPELNNFIEYYSEQEPLFSHYSIESQLQQALERTVQLKSGAYLVFDQTEAMTTIDVNSGSCTGYRNQEQTILNINLEASEVIARQMRLRNLGGIIIIDFIDLNDEKDKQLLIETLKKALAKDNVKTEVSELSSLGLVQMTRKRTRESLERILCVHCSECQKRGSIKSVTTMGYEIFRELRRLACHHSWPGFLVMASSQVIEYLSQRELPGLSDLESQLKKPIKLHVELSYHQEQYNILPLGSEADIFLEKYSLSKTDMNTSYSSGNDVLK